MSEGSQKEWLTQSEVADMFRVSVRHIQKLVASNQFPQPVRLGRCVRFFREDIDAFKKGR